MNDIVLYDDFLEHVVFRAAENTKLSDKVLGKLLDILSSMAFEKDGMSYIEKQAAANFIRNFVLALKEGDGRFLLIQRGLRVDRVVDVEEFVKSREYLDLGMTVWPKLMENLWNLFHGEDSDYIIEVALAGAIGIGKSFFAEVATAYLLYRLSCYHSPQLEYRLAPGSPIVFTMQSVRLEQAKRVLFQPFADKIRRSPYFQKHFPFDPTITTELRFPNQITVMPLSSSDTAALGYNTFGAVLDEVNFLAHVEDSVRVKGTEDIYDQAEKLYTTTLRRIRSRFQVAGKSPGKLFLISSANYPGDFMDRKCKEAADAERLGKRKTIFVIKLARWEALPPGRFSDEKFFVEVGDATKKSRILERKEDAIDPKDVIEVPIDFREDFERDIEAAIRDIAGIPVGGANSFIKSREKIVEAAKSHESIYGGVQLFSAPVVDISARSRILNTLIDLQYLSALAAPSQPFAAHVDIGLSGDSCGIAVAHFTGLQQVGRAFNWDENTRSYVESPGGDFPTACVDGVLEIVHSPNDEVDINLVGDLLLTLASRVNLVWVTADKFQSAALLQKIRKARNAFGQRIRTTLLSVDAHLGPYMALKQAIRDGRIIYPPVPKLLKELRELELDSKRGKVDHPRGGSKDLADAVAGSFYVLSQIYGPKRNKTFGRRLYGEENLRDSTAEKGTRKVRIRRLH
jgi:hypothetical protein